jgi:hypothetical protein
MYACGSTGSASAGGEVRAPFIPPIKWSISVGNDGTTYHVHNAPRGACVKVTWTDSTGAVISSETVQSDSSGSASGQVPAGSVRWEAKVVLCPPPANHDDDEDAGSGGMLFDPQAPGAQRGSGVATRTDILRDFYIWGAPIVPSDDPGADNLTYSFKVRATSWSQAESLIDPIVSGGIGTPVPPSVEVLTFATMEAELAGGRLVVSMPGAFEEFTLDFNNGAFHADLASSYNLTHYPVGSWDVVEMLVPLSDFNFGLLPGVPYSNAGEATYKTDRLLAPVTAGYAFEFSN